jgi:ABC-2 type transport system ATP-binding protein
VPIIQVNNLGMAFRAPIRGEGMRNAMASLVRRRYREIHAVRDVSFAVEPGEIVGFIGPNGAGKTTTLKILSGILHPTAGEVSVMGFQPWSRNPVFLKQLAMVRGSRPITGPVELTVLDLLRFQRIIYEVPEVEFRRSLDDLTSLLDLGPLLERQARALSLGERMRAGLAMSLVYRPRVLFLDEPTLGLDVTAVGVVRRFISEYARESGATVLLTSHYMADVEDLCPRILLIDYGALLYDGDLATLAGSLAPFKLVTVEVRSEESIDWSRYGEMAEQAGAIVSLRVHRNHVPATIARLLAELPVADLSVSDPPLERVIDQVYQEGIA